MRLRLECTLDFAGFQARGANFHLFDGILQFNSDRLQVWQPASLVVRVPVRTQKGIAASGCRTLFAHIATFCHFPNSQIMVGLPFFERSEFTSLWLQNAPLSVSGELEAVAVGVFSRGDERSANFTTKASGREVPKRFMEFKSERNIYTKPLQGRPSTW